MHSWSYFDEFNISLNPASKLSLVGLASQKIIRSLLVPTLEDLYAQCVCLYK